MRGLTRRRRRFGEPMLSVHQRPFAPYDRTQPGHWEGDVIVGPQHRSAIGTLVERHTRFVKLIYLQRPDSFDLHDGLLRAVDGLPTHLLQSTTWDQGSEMARHLQITAATAAKVYFCDSGSPWQRDQRKHQRASVPILSQRNRPVPSRPQRAGPRCQRTQQPAPTRPQ
ncbi:IS30 family transposase [Mycobacterium sp. MUNTM1]